MESQPPPAASLPKTCSSCCQSVLETLWTISAALCWTVLVTAAETEAAADQRSNPPSLRQDDILESVLITSRIDGTYTAGPGAGASSAEPFSSGFPLSVVAGGAPNRVPHIMVNLDSLCFDLAFAPSSHPSGQGAVNQHQSLGMDKYIVDVRFCA
jgi:hypothetical protein